MTLDPSQLLCFATVASTRNVTAAAAQLGISQSAVSKQIKSLERSLGMRLIERTGRGIRLSDAGETLAGFARRVRALLEETEIAMGEMKGLRRGRLRLAASPTIATYLIPGLLVRYRVKYPEIVLNVEIEKAATMTPRLVEGTIDLALTEVAPTVDRLVSRVFMRDPLEAIVPRDHPLAKRAVISPANFLKAGLIVRSDSEARDSFVERALRDSYKGVISPLLRLGSTEAVKEAVAAGLGVAFVSGLAMNSEKGRDRVVRVRVRGVSITRPLYCVRPNAVEPSKAAKAFLCMLDHAARGSLPVLKRS